MITCHSCGETLVDDVDADSLTVAGKEIRFRRTSDYVACPHCGAMRSVQSLRMEAVVEGDLDADDVVAARRDPEAHDVVQEALAEMRAVAEDREKFGREDVEAALALLSDLSQADDESSERGDDAGGGDDRGDRAGPPA